jgi:general secretion pathway protein G
MNGPCHRTPLTPRSGFTLVELVVVVLIRGVIAAIAAPKMFDTADDSRKSSARQNLSIIRDAIELFYLQNGVYPGQSGGVNGLKADLATTMRFPFPACPVGNQNSDINASATSGSLSPSGTQGWAYNKTTGEFIINHTSYSSW